MLQIHPRTLAAFEADARADQRQRFVGWVHLHRATLGDAPPAAAMRLLEDTRPDAATEGADTDDQLFMLAAARGLMPRMTGVQYLLIMDVVFSPDNDLVRVARLAAIREGRGG